MRLITLKTAECEGVEEAARCWRRPRRRWWSPSSRWAQATTQSRGRDHALRRKNVVCGAPNCRVGLRTVYVPLGKKDHRGVESDGMLASAAELGISRDHSGIVELDGAFDLAPDYVIEVDNKSLTHRPDLWGHHGMAREVAAIHWQAAARSGEADRICPTRPPPSTSPSKISRLCPRYSALVFENVTVQPSPLWLQYRLEAIGLNPINNIVDVTNFVMAELAQPMHAFDADKLHGGEIIVRTAREGERIAALNGETYDLDSVEPGDRRSERRHRPGRRDRRRRQRHFRDHHAHRARKRVFQRVQRSQNFVATEAAHRRLHAF